LTGKYWLLSKYVSFCDKVSSPQFSDGKLGKISHLIFGKLWYVAIFRNPTPSIVTATSSLGSLEHLICDVMVISFI